MNFHKQDRPWGVMLSAAKHLTRRPPRCFAALIMTPLDQALSMTPLDQFWSFTFIIGSYRILPMVVVKIHHRVRVVLRTAGQDAMNRVPTTEYALRTQCCDQALRMQQQINRINWTASQYIGGLQRGRRNAFAR